MAHIYEWVQFEVRYKVVLWDGTASWLACWLKYVDISETQYIDVFDTSSTPLFLYTLVLNLAISYILWLLQFKNSTHTEQLVLNNTGHLREKNYILYLQIQISTV